LKVLPADTTYGSVTRFGEFLLTQEAVGREDHGEQTAD
jgi:hypothetical protein